MEWMVGRFHHLIDEWQWPWGRSIGSGKRCHDLACVRLQVQAWYGRFQVGHGSRHWVCHSIERRELAWLSSTHVMLQAVLFQDDTALAPKLKETNEVKKLHLRDRWHCIPLLWRAARRRNLGESSFHGADFQQARGRIVECDVSPRPGDTVRTDQISNKSRHCDAAVLDL